MPSMKGARIVALAMLGIAVLVSSCDKSIVEPNASLPPVEAASVDANAGSWKMIVLSGPDQVVVPDPTPVTGAAYQAELQAVKTAQANMTDAQRAAVRYWTGAGVLRWNEIERELVARYNLPPAPRADGSYPLPDAENPFSDPVFPFSNPPYAARAYSYVSVAQYEALKAAWYWKFRFNRLSPARNDPAVATAVAASALPSYPSEDAVLSGVTAEMLKLLFPASLEEITRKAAEEREAAILSGRATASDVAAGLALGKSIAALVINRARADGMSTAPGNPAMWKSLSDAAAARGETPWQSQETPARAPLLMNFGTVKAWTMTAAQVTALEPGAPPSTSSQQMKDELATVKNTIDNLTRDQLAIALKWNDGAGTATPPGHWNAIASDYVRDARMSEVRAARVYAMLNMAMHDVAVGCWDTKMKFFNPRPAQLDPSIKTMIGLPNFPAFPSGHSTFSGAAATTLSYFFPQARASFDAMADEAGISRLYGGIHYPSDIREGKAHGTRIGEWVLNVARADGAN
ncbi:MAG: PA-phosphatase [Gemmatimonadetes bacterium]|nr:MAG: PA-phosphatase [Gemmatimonadota bacterium]